MSARKEEGALARACKMPADPAIRSAMGYADASKSTGGLILDVPGQLIVMSLHTRAAEAKAEYNSKNSRGAK